MTLTATVFGTSGPGGVVGYRFNLEPQGGTAPITYSYSPAPDSNGYFQPGEQSYNVTITATDADGCTATATGTIPIAVSGGEGGENEDGSGCCCLPGYYRPIDNPTGPCIPVPTGGGEIGTPSVPAMPGAPTVAKSCDAQTLTITAPAFPAQATRIEIQREGSSEIFHTFEAPGSFPDPAPGQGAHRYRAAACNALGCSVWGDWSAALGLASVIVPAWVSPAPNAAVAGIVQLVASAGPRGALYADNPVSMRVFGGALDVTFDAASNTWHATFDSAMEYQGALEVELQARDLAGCFSVPVLLSLNLDNSLERGARWSEKELPAATCAEMLARGEAISTIGYYATVVQRGAPDEQRFFRWFVVSPDPGAAMPEMRADDALMRARVLGWQDANFNDTTRLISPVLAGATKPDHTVRLAMQSQACEVMNLFKLDGARGLKMRQTQDDEVEILTDTAWLTLGKSGLQTRAKFADFDIDGIITDGARIGDKIYLARDNSYRVVVINTLAGKVTAAHTPWKETRHVSYLENWGEKPLAIYSGAGGATGYVIEGDSFDDPFVTSASVQDAWVRGDRLTLALGDNSVVTVGADGVQTALFQHDTPITALQTFEDETEFGDEDGRAFSLDDGMATPIAATLGGEVADAARFKGVASSARGVLVVGSGPNVAKLFLKNGAFYEPRWNLADLQGNPATKTVAMARLLIVEREASGDPLKGGDPGLVREWLVVLFETIAGVFLARIQEADVDVDKCQKGYSVIDQIFKRVRAS